MLARAKQLTRWWLPVAILCPSLIWVALDHAVWPWDQAWFGAQTVTLYETLRADPLAWPGALLARDADKTTRHGVDRPVLRPARLGGRLRR